MRRAQPKYRAMPVSAPKVGWHDTTSYSQGDKDRTPISWSVNIGKHLHLHVTCGHIDYKGQWIGTCEPFFRQRVLGQNNAAHAREMAMRLLQNALAESVDALASVVPLSAAQGDKT